MPMMQIDAEKWPVGAEVCEVISRSNNVKVTRGVITKLTKTRVTATFEGGRTDQYYDRGWGTSGALDVMGSGQHAWTTTHVRLYPADSPDIPEYEAKARAYRITTALQQAAVELQAKVSEDRVEAMRRALDAWEENQ